MQDRLKTLFEMQESFDRYVKENRKLPDFSKDEWVQKECIALFTELSEVLEEVNWKWWKNKKEVDYDKVKEELIDVFHFFMSLCLKLGMGADELFDRYMAKNKENFDRQNGISSKKGYALNEVKN